VTKRVAPGKVIVGELGEIEAGTRQMIRTRARGILDGADRLATHRAGNAGERSSPRRGERGSARGGGIAACMER
jgi:hypothetical protein